ncbi:MAG: replicative DNA helicase [Betaproteobacteria bacterium]|nr:replicative DNA helicase [Betaproteobacteria bacterium]
MQRLDALPRSIEAEQSVLGALLLDGNAIDRIPGLRPEHFASVDHRLVFQGMLDCAEVGDPIDVVTVATRLEQNDRGDRRFLAYLGELAQNTPSAHNVGAYARVIQDRALERALLAALGEAAEVVHSRAIPWREKLDQVQAKVMAVTESASNDPIQIGEAASAYREALATRGTAAAGGVQTQFVDLDRKIGSLRPGDLIVIAGRPSMGKSALAFQIAERAAIAGRPVLLLSMEMPREQVLDRIVSGITRIAVEKIISGEQAKHPNVEAALRAVQKWPLYLDDSASLSIHEVRAKARSIKRRHGLDLLVLDYLQLMPGEGENRNAEIAAISRGLKALAKEINVPVVALSQLNRAVDSRHDRRPQLSDLRDSGAIEQDADIVMFVHREELYRPNDPEWTGKGEVLIRKNRQGATGDVRLTWLGPLTRFENFAGEWPSDSGSVRPMRRRAFGDD